MGAPNGSAERSLDGEDHFETVNEGENSAPRPGPKLVKLTGVIAIRYNTLALGGAEALDLLAILVEALVEPE